MLREKRWRAVEPPDQRGAVWHWRLLSHLFISWRLEFVEALRSGAAYLMARKSSVLAPYERIAWDQWQFFTLDDDVPQSTSKVWHDPREPFWSRILPSSATAGGGERLYSIYVAPGRKLDAKSVITAEDKCLQWLLELLRDSPERPPSPLESLAGEATKMFLGLSKSGFRRCVFKLQAETG